MKRYGLKLLLCWMCLLLATFLFSDSKKFTFEFDGEMLSQFVVSTDEAEIEEQNAQDIKFDVQYKAAKRNYAGVYEGISTITMEDARRAVDNGLNLMWGDYDIEIGLDNDSDFTGKIICPGKQSFIRHNKIEGKAENGLLTAQFTVTDSAEHIRLATDFPENVHSVKVIKRGTTMIDADLLAYMMLLGCALSIIIILGNDKRDGCRERRGTAFILLALTVFASMPLFWNGIFNGHDLIFHVNRIEGIASALRYGQFPVRIHASTMQGYGYAVSEFYPEFFMYLPAILRNLGMTVAGTLKILVLLINAATVISCYFSVKRLCKRRDLAVSATILYVISIYRLVNLYNRATYGESLAMIFFPMLILAMYEIIAGDVHRWPLLALAMTGIAYSHLLSTLFCTLFCALAFLLYLPRVIQQPNRLVAILAAAIITMVCNIGFLIPMRDYMKEGINTNVSLMPQNHTLSLGGLLIAFAGNKGYVIPESEDYACNVGVIPGLTIVAGTFLFAMQIYQDGKGKQGDEKERIDRVCKPLLVLGGLAMLMATDVFPWKEVSQMRWPICLVAQQMQFPWRFIGLCVGLLSVTAAWGFLRNDKWRRAGIAGMITISILTAAYTMQCKIEEAPLIYDDSYTTSWIGQSEYVYLFTDNEALWPGDLKLRGMAPREILEYEKNGPNLSFTIKTTPGNHVIDLPLLYYVGYKAEGEKCGDIELVRGPNNVIQLVVSDMEEVSSFRVWFETPTKWNVASCISMAAFVLLLYCLFRKKKDG